MCVPWLILFVLVAHQSIHFYHKMACCIWWMSFLLITMVTFNNWRTQPLLNATFYMHWAFREHFDCYCSSTSSLQTWTWDNVYGKMAAHRIQIWLLCTLRHVFFKTANNTVVVNYWIVLSSATAFYGSDRIPLLTCLTLWLSSQWGKQVFPLICTLNILVIKQHPAANQL